MQADLLRAPVGPGAIHVERYGHGGTAVILLHGFGTCNFLWRAVAPSITAAGHTAYSVDLLGHGQSDRPLDADFGIAAQAEYLDAAMTVLRVARAVVVGVDIGGDVAMKLAANRPDRVEKLVLINTPAYEELGAAPLLEGVLKGSVADQEHMPMKLIARYLAPFVGKDGAKHLLTLASAIQRADLDEEEYAEIKVPTLIIWGDEDKWVDPKLADRLVNAIPDARLVRLAGIARLIPEENPEHLSELLLDFIKRRAAA